MNGVRYVITWIGSCRKSDSPEFNVEPQSSSGMRLAASSRDATSQTKQAQNKIHTGFLGICSTITTTKNMVLNM